MQRNEVSIVSDHEDAIPEQRDTAIDSARRVADQSLCQRTRIMPDLTAGARVKRISFIGGGDVHHAAGNHWRDLQTLRVRYGEKPLWRQTGHVAGMNLSQAAMTIPAEAAMVRRPLARLGIDQVGKR